MEVQVLIDIGTRRAFIPAQMIFCLFGFLFFSNKGSRNTKEVRNERRQLPSSAATLKNTSRWAAGQAQLSTAALKTIPISQPAWSALGTQFAFIQDVWGLGKSKSHALLHGLSLIWKRGVWPAWPLCPPSWGSKHSGSCSELYPGYVISSISWGESGRMGSTEISKELCQPLP